MSDVYAPDERRLLLELSRHTLEEITAHRCPPIVDLDTLPPALREHRACFVTMHLRSCGSLRGCTGTLIAQHPLALQVVFSTVQTAFSDPRFLPVQACELPDIQLEVSILTPSEPLQFTGPDDLLSKLRPCVDGVTLRLDGRRATFLPQVWETCPEPDLFLSLLCQKMGCDTLAWHNPRLEVDTYQAIVIQEPA